jgi:[acyl-carrier-protein] S-malonyltransferase
MRFADAVAVVRQRGRFMHEAAQGRATSMVAVLGLDAERVAAICREAPGFVEAANFNAPGQVAIGGDVAAVQEAAARLRAAGARRIIPLAVSAPFHTSLMQPAARRLAEVLDRIVVRDARIPVVANAHAQPVRTAAEIRQALIAQVSSPVRWEQSVRALRGLGAAAFAEVGPGTTLAGLIRKTLPAVLVCSVENPETVEAAVGMLRQPAAPGLPAARHSPA